jgi:hypothetical protein
VIVAPPFVVAACRAAAAAAAHRTATTAVSMPLLDRSPLANIEHHATDSQVATSKHTARPLHIHSDD